MWDHGLITYCGLHCGLCAERNLLPSRSKELLDLVRNEGYDSYYHAIPELRDHYPSFVKVLEGFSIRDCRCRRDDGGPANCPIRACAKAKGVIVCMDCAEFPCGKWLPLTRVHPTLLADAELYRREGQGAWLVMQRERAARGFHYGMVKMSADGRSRSKGEQGQGRPIEHGEGRQ